MSATEGEETERGEEGKRRREERRRKEDRASARFRGTSEVGVSRDNCFYLYTRNRVIVFTGASFESRKGSVLY